MKSNKSLGNGFEAELCNILSDHGFWAHNMAQNQTGQPADIIAARGSFAYLIDCKVCSGDEFSKNRIEENQRSAMTLWQECRNREGWFAIKMGDTIFMITLHLLDASCRVTLKREWFEKYAVTLDDWMGRVL